MTRIRLLALIAVSGVALAVAQVSSSGGKDTVTLTVWDHYGKAEQGGKWADTFDRLNREFEASHPNIKIKRVTYPWTAYFQKLRAAVATKRGFDVGQMYASGFLDPYKKGLLPLDGIISPAQKKNLRFIDQSRPPSDGKAYVLPWGVITGYIYFNKDLLKQVGLNPNTPPTTWDQLLSACRSLKDAGITPMAGGFKPGGYLGYSFLSELGGQLFSLKDTVAFWRERISWNDPRVRRSLGYIKTLYDECYTEDSLGRNWPSEVEGDFLKGKAAFLQHYDPGVIATYEKQLGKGKLGAVAPPRLPDSKWPPYMDTQPWDGWMISKWTSQREAAYQYISFMVAPHAQEVIYRATGTPVNHNQAKMPANHPVLRQVLGWIRLPANHLGIVPSSQEEIDVMNKLWPELFAARITIDEFINQLEPLRKRALERLGRGR